MQFSLLLIQRHFRDIISQLVDNIGLNNVTFGAYIKYAGKVISVNLGRKDKEKKDG